MSSDKIVERVAGKVMASGKTVREFMTFDDKAFLWELLSSLRTALRGTRFPGGGILIRGGDRYYVVSLRTPILESENVVMSYKFELLNASDGDFLGEDSDTLWIPVTFSTEQIVGVIVRKFYEQKKRWLR